MKVLDRNLHSCEERSASFKEVKGAVALLVILIASTRPKGKERLIPQVSCSNA